MRTSKDFKELRNDDPLLKSKIYVYGLIRAYGLKEARNILYKETNLTTMQKDLVWECAMGDK